MKNILTLLFVLAATTLFSAPPVKWGGLSAVQQKDHTKLTWSTLAETNNRMFVIQRSADAENWSSIAEIVAGQLPADYTYVDKTPLTGLNYYRVKQIDMNGDFSFSQTVWVTFKNNSTARLITEPVPVAKLSPNPATAYVNVRNVAIGDFVKVTDAQGKTQILQEITTTSFVLETAFLPKGVYFVSFADKSYKVINTQKLIIQ